MDGGYARGGEREGQVSPPTPPSCAILRVRRQKVVHVPGIQKLTYMYESAQFKWYVTGIASSGVCQMRYIPSVMFSASNMTCSHAHVTSPRAKTLGISWN